MRVFISHAGRDQAWAEWIAWQLEYGAIAMKVELDSWDWQTGDNFLSKMNDALTNADAMVAVFSQAYFDPARWTRDEWQAAMHAAKQRPRFLLPVRIDDTPAPPLLAGLIAPSLHNKSAEAARRALQEAVCPPGRPDKEPEFPGGLYSSVVERRTLSPRLPGALPAVWGEVPIRNAAFTGRDDILLRLRDNLRTSGRSIVQSLNGTGGVGKTQLAMEYVWRFACDYDAVWWIHAEQANLIGEQYAAFGAALDLIEQGDPTEQAVQVLRRYCRTHDRWLVVLDNATSAANIQSWLLAGPGHILVTSRDPADWRQIAAAMPVDVFARPESVALLHFYLPSLSQNDANQLAEALGDLPLAVAQAASVLGEGIQPNEYLSLLAQSSAEVLAEGRPLSYPASLAAAIIIAIEQLSAVDRAAAQLVAVCAMLGPEPIPIRWFLSLEPQTTPEPLASISQAPLAYHRMLRHISSYGLAQIAQDTKTITLHRLTQQIIRSKMGARAKKLGLAGARIMAKSAPVTYTDPASWKSWTELIPHLHEVVASFQDEYISTSTLSTVSNAALFLLSKGELRRAAELMRHIGSTKIDDPAEAELVRRFVDMASVTLEDASLALRDVIELFEPLHTKLERSNEIDTDLAMVVGSTLGFLYSSLGRHEDARDMHSKFLDRSRDRHGTQHPETLLLAGNLGYNLLRLGELEKLPTITKLYGIEPHAKILVETAKRAGSSDSTAKQ